MHDPQKVIVRLLPPNIPEHVVWQSMEHALVKDTFDWRMFYKGKLPSNASKQMMHSRAYIHFKSLEALVSFTTAYQGHTFQDSKGRQYRALVEFAPFQKSPVASKKVDHKQNTIATDPDYLQFLDNLANPAKLIETEKSLQVLNNLTKEEKMNTPLVQHLRTKQAQKSSAGNKDAHDKKNSKGAKNGASTSQQTTSEPTLKGSSKSGKSKAKSAAAKQAGKQIAKSASVPAPAPSNSPTVPSKSQVKSNQKDLSESADIKVKQTAKKTSKAPPKLPNPPKSEADGAITPRVSTAGGPPKAKREVPKDSVSANGSVEKQESVQQPPKTLAEGGKRKINPHNRLLSAALGGTANNRRSSGTASRNTPQNATQSSIEKTE